MDILLYYDVFELVLNNSSSILKEENVILLEGILNYSDNKIVYSDKYFNHLENYFSSINKSSYINELQTTFLRLFDENRIESISNCDLENRDEEFICLHNNHANNVLFTIAINYKQSLSSIRQKLIVVQGTQPNPNNKNWVYLKLAAGQEISIRPAQFNSKAQILNFFKNIYEIPKNINRVYIFSDYFNFSSNDCFQYLCNNGIPINYYSRATLPVSSIQRRDLTPTEISENKNRLTDKFGTLYNYFVTPIVPLTHRRRIVFENMVIYCDIDFNRIKSSSDNWVITINYSQQIYQEIIHTTLSYIPK